MLANSSFLDNARRESRKKRRLSERRRVFGRLQGNQTGDYDGDIQRDSLAATSFSTSRDRRRSSIFRRDQQATGGPDELATATQSSAFLMASGDHGKISMKIQFHITVAPDNEPLLLDTYQLTPTTSSAAPPTPPTPAETSSGRQMSSDTASSAIGEHINERLSRQSSSTRRRQQLLAMHQQSALDRNNQQQQAATISTAIVPPVSDFIQSEDNLTLPPHSAPDSPVLGREPGVRSSTISGGMQDEATMQFLARHQVRNLNNNISNNNNNNNNNNNRGGSLTSSGSLVGQHQTLMSASNNIRHRQEQREHIYFKRDGQRFGHEFTLKLAVDKSYRCLLKLRPLIPLEALSIQGHHVSFVDCSSNSSFSSTISSSSGLGSSMSSSAPASSITLSGLTADNSSNSTLRQQQPSSANILNGPRHNSIASTMVNGLTVNSNAMNQQTTNHHQRRLNHAQTTIGSGVGRRTSTLMGQQSALDSPLLAARAADNGSSSSLAGSANARLQQQLLKQQQHYQMIRHFSASSSLSSSHMGGQLVYMFDWSASRFEVNKNKARTQVQTVLKFRNGQILSLPMQVKFYQPECKQHLSWGSQLHFIDYDCNIDSMGQMNVDRIQYY